MKMGEDHRTGEHSHADRWFCWPALIRMKDFGNFVRRERECCDAARRAYGMEGYLPKNERRL